MVLDRPSPSRSTSHSSDRYYDTPTDPAPHQQSGRTSTGLVASSSAQSLREAARRSRTSSREHLPTTADSTDSEASSTRPPSLYRQPSHLHQPVIPSPLNNTSSSSFSGSSSRKETESRDPLSASPDGLLITAPSSPFARPSQPLRRVPRFPSNGRPGTVDGVSRYTQPRSIRDLGSDYTRYHVPLPRNTGYDGINLAAPRAYVPAVEPTPNPANPFEDSNRLSSPSSSTQISLSEKSPSDGDKSSRVPCDPERMIGASAGAYGDPEKTGYLEYIDDRFGAPGYNFPLINDGKEEDDDMHMPMWDDDQRLKPTLRDRILRGNTLNTIGGILMVIGLMCIFVILPIISWTGTNIIDYSDDTPLDQVGNSGDGPAWAHVNDDVFGLLTNVRTGLIDPDTPDDAMTKTGVDGDDYILVYSDEFNTDDRTFYSGDEAYWYGFDGWYGATNDLEWYDPYQLSTKDGVLHIKMEQVENHDLDYLSGMLNSWNQICFKGGIFEVSISLPGPAGAPGLWPGIWTMGNLGRPGYTSTTDGLWPYTYDTCDSGITPNQSMTDGTSLLPGQRLPSCSCAGEDHPTPGTGRGAPEIDIAEFSSNYAGLGVCTQSYQVAPFDVWYHPDYDFMECPDYNISYLNVYSGGPYQQAVSTTTMLNNKWYDGEEYQRFSFEYEPGDTADAYVAWLVGDDVMMKFDARAIGPNGNIGQRDISREPMALVLNLGMSYNWVSIDFAALSFPTTLRVDYVRWYQRPGEESVTCDPPGYETTDYIAAHPEAYDNANKTLWSETSYSWPKNTYMHGCEA